MGNDGVAYILDNKGNVIGHRERSVVENSSNMIEADHNSEKMRINKGVVLAALLMIITCVLLIFSFHF